MKAMILAAGFGTRLLPFTEHTPKPLFTVAGRPLLDLIIHSLEEAGCKGIIVNTHHLHPRIDAFISNRNYSIPVYTRHEPVILGTGGAIKNVADFWDENPFLVINSDIVTDIDLRKVYDFHLSHDHPATLVFHDDPEFNSVSISQDNFVVDFYGQEKKVSSGYPRKLTFTGIQVLDPMVLNHIPACEFSNSIDTYSELLKEGNKIKAYTPENNYWKDVGSPERYREAVFETMALEAFSLAFPDHSEEKNERTHLMGDGSDRAWYRLAAGNRSIIVADHGIKTKRATGEIDSFIAIGRHLHDRGMPVPEIQLYDTFSGLVFMEDLGDVNLQKLVRNAEGPDEIIKHYMSVIDILVELSISGAEDFDLSWTYQTPFYDRELILEKECRYFVDAFLRGYLKMDSYFEDFENEFIALADRTMEFAVNGFMHRDLQSRNIMVKNANFYCIDFQGGRIGPIQYDLAALLIDPYVELPDNIQNLLFDYCVERLSAYISIDPDAFRSCFKYCAITRNLQMLGAFGYLSREKGKTYFEKYIPIAVKTLKRNSLFLEDTNFSKLKGLVERL
jgi:NDP-sugar pyrophosphorylase family protein/tRNA A-37 threonylcarbamoyl transferase component Bud32